ncbi:type II toxin-antitoxin system HicA family toxin [Dyella jejuensis]|uniref:Type II toxin-antitoxin system HicA family toxin n=1 Tax=Dyella jejuensis TaxID=1432009 RepID=A0ABW8JLN8_9GAMM
MSKHAKLIARIATTPPPSDIKWDELKGALKSLGYELLNGGGSRRKFFHRGKNALIICHEPHSPNEVDKGCLVDVREHLKAHGFL